MYITARSVSEFNITIIYLLSDGIFDDAPVKILTNCRFCIFHYWKTEININLKLIRSFGVMTNML